MPISFIILHVILAAIMSFGCIWSGHIYPTSRWLPRLAVSILTIIALLTPAPKFVLASLFTALLLVDFLLLSMTFRSTYKRSGMLASVRHLNQSRWYERILIPLTLYTPNVKVMTDKDSKAAGWPALLFCIMFIVNTTMLLGSASAVQPTHTAPSTPQNPSYEQQAEDTPAPPAPPAVPLLRAVHRIYFNNSGYSSQPSDDGLHRLIEAVRKAYNQQPSMPIVIHIHGSADKSVRKKVAVYDGSLGEINDTFTLHGADEKLQLALQQGVAINNLQLAALRAYWGRYYLQLALKDIPVKYELSVKTHETYNPHKRMCVIRVQHEQQKQLSSRN